MSLRITHEVKTLFLCFTPCIIFDDIEMVNSNVWNSILKTKFKNLKTNFIHTCL